MSNREPDWPPGICNAHEGVRENLRNVAVTIFMWALFIFVIQREVRLGWHAIQRGAGGSLHLVDPAIDEFLVQMVPTAAVIFILVTVLSIATLVSRSRREAALLRPQPKRVLDQELASAVGLSVQKLSDIRDEQVVSVDLDEFGKIFHRSKARPLTDSVANQR